MYFSPAQSSNSEKVVIMTRTMMIVWVAEIMFFFFRFGECVFVCL